MTRSCAVILTASVLLAIHSIDARAQEQDKRIGVLLAAGDVAECISDKENLEATKDLGKKDRADAKSGKATSDLIRRQIEQIKKDEADINFPIAILALGDLAYDCGASSAFKCFDATWGQFKDLMLPIPGNHEYDKKRGVPPDDQCSKNGQHHAKPYFTYFQSELKALGALKDGYYYVDFPRTSKTPWRLVAVNSNVGTGAGSGQVGKLKTDLKSSRDAGISCVLVFSHSPFYSSGRHGHRQNSTIDLSARLDDRQDRPMNGVFRALFEGAASVLVSAHDHHYEQLGRANADGKDLDKGEAAKADNGVRSFVVGTGGTRLHGNDYHRKWAFTEAYDLQSYGILRIDLYPGSYTWEFIPTKDNQASFKLFKQVKRDDCNRPAPF